MMPNKNNVSRRGFLKSSGAFTGVSLFKIGAPSLAAITQAACTAKKEASAFQTLGKLEAADLAAIAARILPTTDTPGATEAGVIYFFDRALGAEMRPTLAELRAGLSALNASVSAAHPGNGRYAELSSDAQDEHLATIEDGAFFGLLWSLTMFGFFAMSRYGGNKNKVAWDLIGFEGDHGAWQYPFGYYDAEYAKEQSNGE